MTLTLFSTVLVAFAALASAQNSVGSGPYSPAGFTTDSSLPRHTIYMPNNVPAGVKLPVMVWGNGACSSDGTSMKNFLIQVASHGFIAIASGTPNGNLGQTQASWMKDAIDWAVNNAGKGKYAAVDATKIAAAGMSCGGVEAYEMRGDSRVSTIGIFNSGVINDSDRQRVVGGITKPIFYFLGGSSDIAYNNGENDYKLLPAGTPSWKGNLPVGHGGTYGDLNGGKFGVAGSAWVRWLLKGDTSAASFFTGSGARNDGWSVESKNLERIQVITSPSPAPVTTTRTTTTTKPATSSPASNCSTPVTKYNQCGGVYFQGSKCCVAGTTCTVVNNYYSQCL